MVLLVGLAFVWLPTIDSNLVPLFFVVPLFATIGFALASTRTLRASTWDNRLIESPEDSEVCLVQVSIMQGESRIGRDRGLVWFSEGRLHFVGHASSFVLGGQDIVPTTERQCGPSVLFLRHPTEAVHLLLQPLKSRDAVDEMRRACFVYRFEAFRRQGWPANGRRQWPPLHPWRGVK